MKSFSILSSAFSKKAEQEVSKDPSSYKDLDLRALTTDAEDVKAIIKDPLINGTWVDLGSGLGTTVKTYAHTFPYRKAIGIEREISRVIASREMAAGFEIQCDFREGDLLNCDIPEGDTYFLYFPQGQVLDRILFKLSEIKTFTLVVIESHGDLFPRLKEESWLELIKEIPLKTERHHPSARIFRPSGDNRELAGLHRYSFTENYFLISDGETRWWGDSFGLYASGEDYLLEHPPRTVKAGEIVKTLTKEELPQLLSFLVSLRRLPEIEMVANQKICHGPIRKIFGTETFSVEFPGGEKVEWVDIERIKQGNQLCYDSSSQFFFLPPAP